jgi:Tfp pilus assembly protein PilE
MKYSEGFSVIEGLLIVALVAIVGSVGYLSYVNFLAPSSTATIDVSESPVTVKSTQDLDTVTKELDMLPVDDSELEELDNAVNSF